MKIPRNAQEMREQGYRFLELGICDVCGKTVEWWNTPKQKQIPMNQMHSPKWPAEEHWAENCHLKANLKEKEVGDEVAA